MTPAEVAALDGQDGRDLYVRINGKVIKYTGDTSGAILLNLNVDATQAAYLFHRVVPDRTGRALVPFLRGPFVLNSHTWTLAPQLVPRSRKLVSCAPCHWQCVRVTGSACVHVLVCVCQRQYFLLAF